MRSELTPHIAYVNANGVETQRPIWPLALAYYEEKHNIVAGCTLGQNLHHFRVDRVRSALPTEVRFGKRRSR
jgi:predicted DNA-binding transcriptional regulator YafY